MLYPYLTSMAIELISKIEGLDILQHHVSFSAAYDAERYPKPKCSAETRTRIVADIMNWIMDPEPAPDILWLYGPAGAGKTAIAQTTAELAKESGQLGASFFFSRGAPDRGTACQLFPTLAHQLAENVPEIGRHINHAMETKPHIPTKSKEIQFRELIARPALQWKKRKSSQDSLFYNVTKPKSLPPYIFIDGVDECKDTKEQEELLKVIGEALIEEDLPLRFIISSRPESHIRRLFRINFHDMTRVLVLEESPEAVNDVWTYLHSGFEDIYNQNYYSMKHIKQPWPSSDVMDILCEKSSGHFIYPTTVLKFVGEPMSHPVTQLEIIMKPSRAHSMTSPFSDLDRLYLQVLSTHPRPSELTDIFGYFMVVPDPYPAIIDDLLDFEPGTVATSLNGLHSLINISDVSCYYNSGSFHHASFHDFLVDAQRSGDFHIDLKKYRLRVVQACVDLIVKCLDNTAK